LNIEEFGKLIFSADESLPVDLTRHSKTKREEELDLTTKLLSS
jgi:hypothetical protein